LCTGLETSGPGRGLPGHLRTTRYRRGGPGTSGAGAAGTSRL